MLSDKETGQLEALRQANYSLRELPRSSFYPRLSSGTT